MSIIRGPLGFPRIRPSVRSIHFKARNNLRGGSLVSTFATQLMNQGWFGKSTGSVLYREETSRTLMPAAESSPRAFRIRARLSARFEPRERYTRFGGPARRLDLEQVVSMGASAALGPSQINRESFIQKGIAGHCRAGATSSDGTPVRWPSAPSW